MPSSLARQRAVVALLRTEESKSAYAFASLPTSTETQRLAKADALRALRRLSRKREVAEVRWLELETLHRDKLEARDRARRCKPRKSGKAGKPPKRAKGGKV
jgi:hypothetical protein